MERRQRWLSTKGESRGAMPPHDTFLLHIWYSEAVNGQQLAARLEHLPDGQSQHFVGPEALLAYLRDMARENPIRSRREET